MYIAFKRSLLLISLFSFAVLLLAAGDWAMEHWEIDSLLVHALWHGTIISSTIFLLPRNNQAYRPFAAGRLQRLPLVILAVAFLYMLITFPF